VALDRPVERDEPFSEGRNLGSPAAPPWKGCDHWTFESAVQGIDDKPAFTIGEAKRPARTDNRALGPDRIDQADILRREGPAIGQKQMDRGARSLQSIFFLHFFPPAGR